MAWLRGAESVRNGSGTCGLMGVPLLPAGLCLFGEAVVRRGSTPPEPRFWIGTLSPICINAGIGLMIESGLLRGYPRA